MVLGAILFRLLIVVLLASGVLMVIRFLSLKLSLVVVLGK